MLYTCNGHSAILKTYITYYVIIPSWYRGDTLGKPLSDIYPDKRQPLPVLYLFHGGVADASCWLRYTQIEAYAEEKGMAVVMPNVGNSYYTDMMYGPAYFTFISEELPRMVGSVFPISEKREENFTAGLSMGGYGALKLALRKPECYSAAISLSGVVDIMDLLTCGLWEDLLDLDAIFGSDRDKVRGSLEDIYFLTGEALAKGKVPDIYLACGSSDYFAKTNQEYHEYLAQNRVSHRFVLEPGNHDWDFWNPHLKEGIDWLFDRSAVS